MLRCPVCGQNTKVKETGVRPRSARLLSAVLIDWPTACWRTRRCLNESCRWKGGSVELTFPDLIVLLTDTGKAFMAAHRRSDAEEQPQG
jgi:hypothetical protein